MRWSIPASVAVHAGLIVGAWLFLQQSVEDLSSEDAAVSISIVQLDAAVTETSETVSEETANLVSAGTAPVDAATEMTEATEETDAVETVAEPPALTAPPTESIDTANAKEAFSAAVLTAAGAVDTSIAAPVPQSQVDVVPIVADTVAPSTDEVLERLDLAAKLTEFAAPPETPTVATADIAPVTPAEPAASPEPPKIANLDPVAEPLVDNAMAVPPVPRPRIVRKPVEAEEAPAKGKEAKEPVEARQSNKVSSLGNGGESAADSAAAKPAGGKPGKLETSGGSDAAYAGKVRAKVIKALKRPSGKYRPGEVRISFAIDPSGRLASIRIGGSSGDAKVDKAALTAVQRAAPFPAFDGGAPRSFTFPLVIQ